MTMEYKAGHYFKRLTMIDMAFGDADHHLRELAEGRRADIAAQSLASSFLRIACTLFSICAALVNGMKFSVRTPSSNLTPSS